MSVRRLSHSEGVSRSEELEGADLKADMRRLREAIARWIPSPIARKALDEMLRAMADDLGQDVSAATQKRFAAEIRKLRAGVDVFAVERERRTCGVNAG